MPLSPPSSSFRRVVATAIAVAVVALTLGAGLLYWRHLQANPLSEDAMIQANVVHISAAVPGKLDTLTVGEGDRVERGQLLFTIDPLVYQLRVEQAQAELAAAEAALATETRRIRAETANAVIADEQIARARANLELAQKTVERLKPLAAKGYVPAQQLDAAVTAERDARVSLSQAQSQAAAARQLVGEEQAAQAAVRVAQSALAIAQKALQDTRVYAPNDGLVVGLNISPGEHLAPGEALFTLINSGQWYATAFFRETDLQAIRVGACATVYTMADPALAIPGRVSGIGWGISSEDMIALPRALPYVQKSLNWVRVAQRFPVRVALQSPPPDLMRIGASATVAIRADAC